MAARKKSTATKKSSSKKRSSSRKSSRKPSRPSDALALLRADHQAVQKLFDQFEKTRSDDRKSALAEQICKELSVHAQIEEEIFYPAAREAMRDEDLIDEATVEHASAKDLIAQIQGGSTEDDLFDARVTVLSEYIKHHVKEEQNEMFPKVRKTKLDLKELGQRLETRKMELMSGGGESGAGGSPSGALTKSASSGRLSGSRAGKGGKTGNGSSGRQGESFVAAMARGMGLTGT